MSHVTNLIYMRMFMYVLTLVVHISNATFIDALYQNVADDPVVKLYYPFHTRYYTVWNVILQMIYAFIGLICDGLTLIHSLNKDLKLLKYLGNFRNTFFSVFVWPLSGGVFTVYWTIYNYDKNLISPPFLDKIMTPSSNHILHTFIILVVLWEVWFQPRLVPRSHMTNFICISLICGVSLAVPLLTYIRYGVWIYPFLEVLYGTIYFFVAYLFMYSAIIGSYFIQWPIVRMLWSQNTEVKLE